MPESERPEPRDITITANTKTDGEEPTSSIAAPKPSRSVTVKTRPVSSEELPAALQRAALGSMMRLRKSQLKLLSLMEECVKDSDLEKSAAGDFRVPVDRIEQAIRCANALAHHTQVGVNMLKAVSDFTELNN